MNPISNADLAKEVLRRIKSHPDTFDQGWWLKDDHEGEYAFCNEYGAQYLLKLSADDWECGTTACLAGHIVSAALNHDEGYMDVIDDLHIAKAAAVLIGLRFNTQMFSTRRHSSQILDWLECVANGVSPEDAEELILNP